MKKIFTLMAGLFMAVAVMAADHNPDLTIRSQRNFKVVIDGRAFYTGNAIMRINNLKRGHHSVQVFEMRRGYFGQREKMLTSTSFKVGKQDLRMRIDQYGRVNVISDYDRNDSRYGNNNRDDEWDRDNDRNDPRYRKNNRDDEWDRDHEKNNKNERPYDRRDDDHRRY